MEPMAEQSSIGRRATWGALFEDRATLSADSWASPEGWLIGPRSRCTAYLVEYHQIEGNDERCLAMTAPTPPVIEVFADIWCPFAHVGLRAVSEQRARSGRMDVLILVRAWPLELVNGAPLDPGVTQAHAAELREQVAATLFRDLDIDRFPRSTLDALALVARAYRSNPRAGERLSFALRDALFEHGQDISDPVVLRGIADDLGVAMPEDADHAAVLADWKEGQRRGVLGSPHFFCGDADAFCPSLEITKDRKQGVSILMDTSGLIRFLERCFGAIGEQTPGGC